MKLPLKFLEKREKAEFYLALILLNEKATSVIFEKQGEELRFVSSDDEYFKETIEEATENEFLDVLDKVITTAETALPDNIETHKTIFGLKDSWIEEDRIKKEYREKLKKAGDELALEPIGFLAFSESLINLMQKEEGAPVTTILVSVGKKYLTVYWIRAGKILEIKSSEIHESAPYTTDALMKHFQTGGNLPTKVVLFDSEEEELTQEFIGHQWSKSLSFLHLPQIVSLPQDAGVKAMLLGAATQMNTKLILDYTKDVEDQKPEDLKPAKEAEAEAPKEEMTVKEETEDNKLKDDSFEVNDEEESAQPQTKTESNDPEFFGFMEGVDVVKNTPEKISEIEKIPQQIIKDNFESIPEAIKDEEEKTFTPAVNAALVTEKIKQTLSKLFGFI